MALSQIIPISKGGTNATTAANARTNLGVPTTTAGIYTEPSYTDNGNGTITLGSAQYAFFADADGSLPVTIYTIAGATYSLTDNSMNYIVADYNGGSPTISVLTNASTVNNTTIIPIVSMFRYGTSIDAITWDKPGKGLANKLMDRFVKTQRFAVEPGGLILGEAGTRNVTVTGGYVWNGVQRNNLSSFTSATDEMKMWYHVGGVWTMGGLITQYDNTQYDDGTGLQTLTNNRYAVNWVFRLVSDTVKETYIVLGTGDYTQSEAENSQPPASLPTELSGVTVFVGRIIVQKSASTAYQIDSAFETVFSAQAVTAHNDLSGLQGGTSNQYYHMTSAEYTGTGSGNFVRATSPTLPVDLTIGAASSATGVVKFLGTTSGTVSLSVADAAGTWTMKLPTSAGTNGYVLSTDGSGNTSWIAAGAGDMVLASIQTVTGAKTFNDATLLLAGATSGATTLKAAAIAGTTTVTLPGSTTTLVGTNTTDELTNKTLISPKVGKAGGTTGKIDLYGTTSGVVSLSVADTAGTWTMKLPTSSGTNKYLLQTDGSGNTSWAQADLTASITGTLPIANGGTNNSTAFTAGSIIFSDGTKLTQDNTNLFWDDTNNYFGLGTATPGYPLDIVKNWSNLSIRMRNNNNPTTTAGQAGMDFGFNDYRRVTFGVASDSGIGTLWNGRAYFLSIGNPNGLSLQTYDATPIQFVTAQAQRAIIDGTGLFGVGVTPTQQFQVLTSTKSFSVYAQSTYAGTSTNEFSNAQAANYGEYIATTTGYIIGQAGYASGGDRSYGGLFRAIISKNSATNIGVAGYALNAGTSPTQIGGYFALLNSAPTLTSAALLCDNGATTSPIFVCKDAGSTVFSIVDGGNVYLGGSSAPTAKLHIAAGTASANTAPIKLTSGTVNTTPESGAIEFDGTDFWLSI